MLTTTDTLTEMFTSSERMMITSGRIQTKVPPTNNLNKIPKTRSKSSTWYQRVRIPKNSQTLILKYSWKLTLIIHM